MAGRVWGAISTFGISELVRLADEDSGDAIGNVASTWNPIANAGLAVTNTVVQGDLSRLQDAIPNPVRMAGSATNAVSVTTRRIPGVNNVTEGVDATVSGFNRFCDGATGSLINNISPAQRGGPDLDGYAYACAKVMDMVYTPYGRREPTLFDRENDLWAEVPFDDLPEPANRDHICVYKCGSVAIVGCRGSVDCSDWACSNTNILVGAIPLQRCLDAENFVRRLMRRGEFTTYYLSGHSLGGTIAIYVGLKLGLKVHAFNAGAGPSDGVAKAIMQFADGASHADVILHRIRNDVVSAFSARLSNTCTVRIYNQTQRGLAHDRHQFL